MSSVGAFERQRQIPSLFVRNCITRGTLTPRSKQSGAGLREGLHSDALDATTGPSAGRRTSLQPEAENGRDWPDKRALLILEQIGPDPSRRPASPKSTCRSVVS